MNAAKFFVSFAILVACILAVYAVESDNTESNDSLRQKRFPYPYGAYGGYGAYPYSAGYGAYPYSSLGYGGLGYHGYHGYHGYPSYYGGHSIYHY